MVRPTHQFSVATFCLAALASFAQANDYPCAGERCLPRSAAPAAAAPAAAPADAEEEPEAAPAMAASAPAMFAAPTPSGEVQGARSSYLLPSMEFSLPSMSLGLPQFRLLGMGRNRREPYMKLDSGTAPLASGAPAVYGPLLGASLQHRAAAPASAAPAEPAPAKAAPANAAPAGCDNSCALREQQEEVRQLTQQVQQLQGLLLQLAEQQASGQQAPEQAEAGTEQADVETEQPPREVSYVPRKAKMVSSTRHATTYPVKNIPANRELHAADEAAAERLARLQQLLEEKQAEMEALQSQQEEIEAEEQAEIAAEEKRLAARKKQLEAERVSRLRNRMARESAPSEPVARKAAMIEQMNYESETEVEPEAPVPVAPKKLMNRSSRTKATPVSQSRWRSAEEGSNE